MSSWGISEYSGIITPGFFIVLLVVLWKMLRSINGLYTVMVYNNDQIKAVSEMLERLLGEGETEVSESEDSRPSAAKRPKKAAKPPKPATAPAPPPPEPADADERRLFVVPNDDTEQTKRKILSLLRQQPGLGYSGLAEKLGITVPDLKALCAELEREGKIAGRR